MSDFPVAPDVAHPNRLEEIPKKTKKPPICNVLFQEIITTGASPEDKGPLPSPYRHHDIVVTICYITEFIVKSDGVTVNSLSFKDEKNIGKTLYIFIEVRKVENLPSHRHFFP